MRITQREGIFKMMTFLTAARFYAGYKLKALSFLVFITIGLGLVMGAVDLLYNSFNTFFDRPASYFLPRYLVTQKKGLDILGSSYGMADISLRTEQREAVAKALAKDFTPVDVAYAWAMYQARSGTKRQFYALVIGFDFSEIGTAFPYFKDKLTPEDVAA